MANNKNNNIYLDGAGAVSLDKIASAAEVGAIPEAENSLSETASTADSSPRTRDYLSSGVDSNVIPNTILFNKIASVASSAQKARSCPLSGVGAPKITWKNVELLKKYTSEEKNRILSTRFTGVSAKKQRQLKNAIKIARLLALLP
ncbi:30S ribosomal subunit protein S18 (modular protein) [Alphaproteobacteria bacterium]